MSNIVLKRKAMAAAVASALALPTATTAVESGFYGHVNRAVVFADDGEASDVHFVDSSANSTRFGWRGNADIGRGMKAGARIEMSTESNLSSSRITIKGRDASDRPDGGTFQGFRVRHSYVWFTGNWGTLTLGQTGDAVDGIAFADLSGAWLAAENYPDYSGRFRFRNEATGATTALSVSYVFQSFDGARSDLVKYDSPSFGPFSVSVSATTNNAFQAAGWLDTALAGGQLWAGLGYSEMQPEDILRTSGDGSFRFFAPSAAAFNERQVVSSPGGKASYISGSASYKFSQGTNIAFAYAFSMADEINLGPGVTNDVDDADHWFVALGHDWGNNSARVYYQETDGGTGIANRATYAQPGCEGDSIGVGFNHAIPKPKVDLYAGYAHHTADCSDTPPNSFVGNQDFQDIDAFFVGGRVAFD